MAKTLKIDLADKEPKLGRDHRAIRRELQNIQNADPGKLLKADAVVASAAEATSPLHRYFEWRDDKAAHQFRLAQARALIRTVEVVLPDDDKEAFVPKYLSLHDDRRQAGGGYRDVNQIVKNRKFLDELEETAKRDIDAVLHRYEMLKTLCVKVRQAAGIKP